MATLPDEMWKQIMETGIQSSNFNYRDLCCLSIVGRFLHRLSGEDSLWSLLLFSDFHHPVPYSLSSVSSAKFLYKIRFERERNKERLAHRRALWRKEAELANHSRKILELKTKIAAEREKMVLTATELSNLHKARQASVALNVWQPEIVRGKHKQVVEQYAIPIESRIHGLEMELKLCKQLLSGYDQTRRAEKLRLKAVKEQLASLKYHPLRALKISSSEENESKKKRKKLKISSNCKASNSYLLKV